MIQAAPVAAAPVALDIRLDQSRNDLTTNFVHNMVAVKAGVSQGAKSSKEFA
jgi:hypothetical protein